MAAPFGNKNHLKYTPEKVRDLFLEAIQTTKQNKDVFNYSSLHEAIGLSTLRTLPYLAEKYRDNLDLMQLWDSLKDELDKNLQLYIEQSEQKRLSRNCKFTMRVVYSPQ